MDGSACGTRLMPCWFAFLSNLSTKSPMYFFQTEGLSSISGACSTKNLISLSDSAPFKFCAASSVSYE